LWTPLGRWILFGGLGLVFAYGVYRSASTWTTRSPWKPLSNRAVDWVDDRYQIAQPLQKILKKPVPRYAQRWFYCLGGITAFLFVVQGVTGILLAFYYKPTPDAAYASIQYIENQVYFGSSIRAIHHWCANGMIVICVAHMLRVFIMGAYKRPRELNWVSGVLLLILTLVFGFTGYLLPWDQRAFWATTVGSEIAGAIPAIGNLALVYLRVGWNVTGETLSRFYSLHVIVVPLATVAFMGAHFLMIRRQGVAKPL
jgi:quinol-cytochrome oxidoreductase complex cytochrome b subunit